MTGGTTLAVIRRQRLGRAILVGLQPVEPGFQAAQIVGVRGGGSGRAARA